MGIVLDFDTELKNLNLDNSIKTIPATDTSPEYYASDNGIIKSSFYAVGNKVVFESQGRKFTWVPSSIKYIDEKGTEDNIFNVQEVPLETKANYVRFNRSMPDVDDWFITEDSKLKHQILLQGFQRDPLPWLFGEVDFVFGGVIEFDPDLRVQANGLIITGSFETSGDINILDKDGNSVFQLPQIVAYDSKIPDRAMTYGKYRVNANVEGVLSFDIVVDNAWISDVERVYPIVIDPTVIVASGANGWSINTKPITLANGWFISMISDVINHYYYMYVSKDNGTTWQQLCSIYNSSYGYGTYFSISNYGNIIYAVITDVVSTLRTEFYKIDATTQTNINIWSNHQFLNSFTSTQGWGCCIAVNSTGVITVVSCMTQYTLYPNDVNVVSWRSIDAGVTWTKQDGTAGYDMVTTDNTSLTNWYNPCLIYKFNGFPTLIVVNSGVDHTLIPFNFTGSIWSRGTNLWYDNNYQQELISALTKKNGSNSGRVWYTWVQTDSSSIKTIFLAYSDNNGATVSWPTNHLIAACDFPTFSERSDGSMLLLYQKQSGGAYYQTCPNGSVEFAGETLLLAGLNSGLLISDYAQTNLAPYIYKNATNTQLVSDVFVTNIAPLAPTGLIRPNFDAILPVLFSWTFNDTGGDSQSAFQLVITRVSDGVVMLDTGKLVSTVSSYTLAANVLVNCIQYQWKVSTWDKVGVAGPYSALTSVTPSLTPVATITYPTTDGFGLPASGLVATWNFSGSTGDIQAFYQVKLTDGNDALLYDSGKLAGNTNAYTIPYTFLNGSSCKLKVTLWNNSGLQSAEKVRTFVVSYTGPATPTLIVTPAIGHIDVAITNPVPTGEQPVVSANDLYRRNLGDTAWARISANVPINTTYSDYATASGQVYEYKVTALGVNATTSDSLNTQGTITFIGIWLHGINNPSGTIYQFLSDGNGRNENWQAQSVLMQFAGRNRPVTEFGEMEEGKISAQLELNDADYVHLQSLVKSKSTLCFRDARGRKMFGSITALPIADAEQLCYTATIEINETSYSEVV